MCHILYEMDQMECVTIFVIWTRCQKVSNCLLEDPDHVSYSLREQPDGIRVTIFVILTRCQQVSNCLLVGPDMSYSVLDGPDVIRVTIFVMWTRCQ